MKARGAKREKFKATVVSGGGKGEQVVIMCPKCDTICRPVLRLFGLTKRENGIRFACATLDCGFSAKMSEVDFSGLEARGHAK